MQFTGKVAIVTGASSGIGQRIAIDLAAKGAAVIGCGRSLERLQETLAEMQRLSPSSTVMACDVGDLEQVAAFVQKILDNFGTIDILINNAGFGMRKPLIDTPPDLFEAMMRTNYLGAVYCTRQVLPAMAKQRSGHIVNISSVSGIIGTPNMSGYCATKFALMGLTESLYHELRPLGIHISVVCPGPVRTKFHLMFDDLSPKAPAFLFLDAGAVSRAVLRAIERKKVEVILPRWLALACQWSRWTPSLFRALSYRALRWQANRRESTAQGFKTPGTKK